MSHRKDRLASLLRLREIREDQAKAEVARARRAEQGARNHADEARVRSIEALQPLEGHMADEDAGGTLPPTMVRALQLAGWASAEQLELAEEEYERTVERRAEAQRKVRDAAIGRRSIEKLAKRRQADEVARRRDAADRAMDELYLLSRGGAR